MRKPTAPLRRRQLTRAVAIALSSGLMMALAAHAGVPVVELGDLDGNNGFRVTGAAEYDSSGCSVAGVGDVNGDGFNDFIIGAFGADPNGPLSGSSYVVFGGNAGFPASVSLNALDGSNGFRLDGVAAFDFTGNSSAGAGDVNGDGIDDLVIGAFQSEPELEINAGTTYVVFGRSDTFAAAINLGTLDGTDGFRLDGVSAYDASGRAVAGAGDINGDDLDDIVIGAHFADANGHYSGSSYVVFGRTDGFPSSTSLSALDGTNGFRLDGAQENDFAGFSVAGAGDVNGDGLDDLVIGAPHPAPADFATGTTYVVFGSTNAFPASMDLDALDGSDGFRLNGVDGTSASGFSVASAGDVNGDDLDDLVIGAPYGSRNGFKSGSTYVVFGHEGAFAASMELSSLNGTNGFRVDGIAEYDSSGFAVSSAGDFNGDRIDDVLIGAHFANPNGERSGSTYVVFGSKSTFPSVLIGNELDGTNGFRLDGVAADDTSGSSVAPAGDINGDGGDDLLIGAPSASPNGDAARYSGSSYVVYGTPPKGEPIPPTVSKMFAPSVVPIGTVSTLTITLGNQNDALATLSAPLIDALPASMVVANPANASTTCGSGVVLADSGSDTVTLDGGATISNLSTCTVTVSVVADTLGVLTNTIPSGALQTNVGSNLDSSTANLTLTATAPSVAKDFAPTSVDVDEISVLTIVLTNDNAVGATLSSALTDALPSGLVIADPPSASTSCPEGAVSAVAGTNSVTLETGAELPASASCDVTVSVTSGVAGTYTNLIPVDALQTTVGNNVEAASAILTVTDDTPTDILFANGFDGASP